MTAVWLKWLPAGVVPVVIAGVALTVPLQAAATDNLAAKTPEQVLTMVADSSVSALSGTITQTSDLGLPELPSMGGSSTPSTAGPSASDISSALDLLTGTHTARVYIDGPKNARVQVMDSMAERDVVRHGNDVWLYSSADNTAVHMTLPAQAQAQAQALAQAQGKNSGSKTTSPTQSPTPGSDVQTPAQLAHQLLTTLDPSTTVTVGDNTTVASRSAYDLVLTPRASDTLIGSISIAVDSQTGLPLSVEIQARGQHDPAFQLAFTSLKLQAPDASLFTFTPPKGATVKQQALKLPAMPGSMTGSDATKAPPTGTTDTTSVMPKVIGTGWDSVVELPAGAVPAQLAASPLLTEMTQKVDGGQALSTALVNVLFTNDGRVLAGSVSLDRLQDAAAGR